MIRSLFRDPAIWLGLGVGVLLGILLSSGLKFSDQDASRFLGSVLGSLIAVGSAVSLYFLKEENEVRGRRDRLRSLLNQAKEFVDGLPKELDEKNFAMVTGGLEVVGKYLDRCKRYCEAHEADDYVISMVGNHFDHIDGARFTELVNNDDEYPPQVREEIRKRAIEHTRYLNDCFMFFPEKQKGAGK